MSLMTIERRRHSAALKRRLTRIRPSTSTRPSTSPGAATLTLMAVWLGIATGLIELITLYLRWRFVDPTALSSVQLNQHARPDGPSVHADDFRTLRAKHGHCRRRDS